MMYQEEKQAAIENGAAAKPLRRNRNGSLPEIPLQQPRKGFAVHHSRAKYNEKVSFAAEIRFSISNLRCALRSITEIESWAVDAMT